jgi:uncharacterized delta-60 repeat protein
MGGKRMTISPLRGRRALAAATLALGALVTGAALPALAGAHPGDLDRTFSGNGIATTSIDMQLSVHLAEAVVVQPDERIIAAGRTGTDIALSRYLSDGELDPSFGEDGLVVTELAGKSAALDAVLQPDGKVVVAGNAGGDFALARYGPDGTLDPSFGKDGIVTTEFGRRDGALHILLGSDGELTAIGLTGYRPVMARYTPDGRLDRSFGQDGRVVTSTLPRAREVAAVLQPGGKVVVATASYRKGTVVERFRPDGHLDGSFGGDGRTVTHTGYCGASSAALQSGSRIVIGGTSCDDEGDFWMTAVRLNPDGAVDPSFHGVRIQPHGEPTRTADIVVRPDDKIVATGDVYGSSFVVARLNPDGSPDEGFGEGGSLQTFTPTGSAPHAIALWPGGKVVVAGNLRSDFGLARYDENGDLDSSFGDAGFVATDFDRKRPHVADAAAHGVLVEPNGRIVAAGDTTATHVNFTESDLALARYKPHGKLDRSFGGGTVTTDLTHEDAAADVLRQPDGKLLVISYDASRAYPDPGHWLAVTRYMPDGSIDHGFGVNGTATTNTGPYSEAIGAVLAPDGKIVVVGDSNGDLTMVRYRRSGALDQGFGTDGIATDPNGPNVSAVTPEVAVQPDGKILVPGVVSDFAVARYRADGSRDPSFGEDGMVQTEFSQQSFATDVLVRPNGKIVATGENNDDRLLAASYLADGTPDPSFGDGGTVSVHVSNQLVSSDAGLLQSTGKVVVVGDYNGHFVLVRLSRSGKLDRRFGERGIADHDMRGGRAGHAFIGHVYAEAAALQPDDKVLMVGRSRRRGDRSERFVVARFNG